MMYNFINNLSTCSVSLTSVLQGNTTGILYYSHIPTALVAIIIGIFVFIKDKKSLVSKILLSITICFLIWSILDLLTWLSFDSRVIMIAWSLTYIFEILIYIFCLYFLYIFANKKDFPFYQKIIIGILILPIIIIAPTAYNLLNFDYLNCWANSGILLNYLHVIEAIICIWILFLSLYSIVKHKRNERSKIVLVSFGTILFLFSFFTTGFISGYLTDQGIGTGYIVESYGLLGMTFFIAFLAYLIVKFKTFNIKLIGAQALVWSSVILIGSQFFYLQGSSLTVKILTGITLIITSVLGYILVRGVKKEVVLNEKLNIANTGQKNLIHIMNHQIKGYLGNTKNIFAELLTDDYGKMPAEAKDLITKGLETSEGGVEYVTGILRGDSAESGSLTFDMKPVDFKEIVSGVVEKIKGAIEKKGLKLTVDIANGAYNILGDSIQLGEAVRNLIENSMHYTPSGEISIRLKQAGGKVLLSVKDTGVGIKKEDKDKLFKAGGVGSESIKINVNSSGYGLAFVKGVIEKHKGKVWFESAGAGKGSTFFVELPVK